MIFDFLYYFICLYFIRRPEAVTWSTPQQRATYVLSLTTISWILALEFFIFVHFFKTLNAQYFLLNLPVVVGFIWLFDNIYIIRNRQASLKSNSLDIFKVGENWCIAIALIIFILSTMLPYAILYFNIK